MLKRILIGIAIFLVFGLLVLSGILWWASLHPAEATATPAEILKEEDLSSTMHLVVETFQVLPSGSLDPMTGIGVLIFDGNDWVLVGETAMVTIDGIPAPIWEGEVSVGSLVTIDPPDNCVIWKVGAESWNGVYVISAEYAGTDLPLKFQVVCGEDIPTPTPGPTNPPSGPEVTPTNPPENPTNTPHPTDTPPPTEETPPPTPRPTEVDCNCETPETPVPTPKPPDQPTATPIW